MIKKLALLIPICLILVIAAVAAGGGGSSSDPLASLSYLKGTFRSDVEEKVEDRLDESDEELLAQSEQEGTPVQTAATWVETRLKQGDALLGSTGTNALLLAGGAQIIFDKGGTKKLMATYARLTKIN